MKKIQKLVDDICEELEGAQHYAECYVEKKAEGKMNWANRFQTMSEDELKHAGFLHELAVEEIMQIKEVFKAPAEMQDKWDEAHKHYVSKAAWIKQMLAM